MQDLSFQNLFPNSEIFETKVEKIEIKSFPINKIPHRIIFPNFQLVEGLKYIVNNPTCFIEREIINITKDNYEIKFKTINFYFYRLSTIIVNNKKYNFYTDKKDCKNLEYTSFSSLKEISENPKAFSCLRLSIEKDYLYVCNIDYPQKCNIKDLDECFKIIFYIANVCNIKKLKIIDGSHFLCYEDLVSIPYFRMLGKKSLSIYSKYGFKFEEEPLDAIHYKILQSFNIDNFLDEITLIYDVLNLENFSCTFENRNITSEEFILKSKIFDFVETKINRDIFNKKIDINNCFDVMKIINLIEIIGDYTIKVNKSIINKIFIDIKSVFNKYKNSNPYQVLYL